MEEKFQYAVIGDPVDHSRSPGMQNRAFGFYGMGHPYGKIHVRPEELPEFIQRARREFRGINLTVPHKHAVIPLVDKLSPEARLCGSVNTLKIDSGFITGYSTDGAGFSGAVRHDFGMELAGKKILLLGAGGAATAIAFETALKKADSLVIANRTLNKGAALAEELKKNFPGFSVSAVELADEKALKAALASADLLAQATSCGLKESDSPVIPLDLLEGCGKLRVFDAIYRETPLLCRAKELGLAAADGESMLIAQGACSFEIWTNRKAPMEAMREGFHEEPQRTGD